MRRHKAGIVLQRGTERVFRALKIAYLLQGASPSDVRLAKARFQFQCPAIGGERFLDSPLLPQRVAQVVVCAGKVRLQFQQPTVTGHRFVQLPLLPQRTAQVADAPGMMRRDGENLPVDLLGGLQPAAAVVPDRSRQCLGMVVMASFPAGRTAKPGRARSASIFPLMS